ncbi:hypothetical protein JKP88DRAFT_248311 [Tribonema minus]|uniref:Uncharacterized protein n=1 Tax=Tribonema minus TaxID=303371 RepID=A0A836CAF7_9STRA|nr:hypothetical protein JKP88DRAFT_248311 [Tribonema minus]
MQAFMLENRRWWGDLYAKADDVHIENKLAVSASNPTWRMKTLKLINQLAITIDGQEKRCGWVDVQKLKDATTCRTKDGLIPCRYPLHARYEDQEEVDHLPAALEVTSSQKAFLVFAVPAARRFSIMDYFDENNIVATSMNEHGESSGTSAYMCCYYDLDRLVPLTQFHAEVEGGETRIFTTTTHKHGDNLRWASIRFSHIPAEQLAVITAVAPLHTVLAALRNRTK